MINNKYFKDENDFYFINPDTFEQISLGKDIIGEKASSNRPEIEQILICNDIYKNEILVQLRLAIRRLLPLSRLG